MLEAFANLLAFWPLTYLALGVALGIVVGSIPGLTASMLIALSLPLTFYMSSVDAMTLLIGMYVGGISGGLIAATLLRMPGTPASIMTTFDGYPTFIAVLASLVAYVAVALVTRPATLRAGQRRKAC